MTSDGANETKKFSDLNNEGFSPLYYLVFGEKKLYSVKYKSRGVTQTVKVPGSLFKDISCRTILKRDLKPLSFNIKNGIVAILTIRSFSSQQLKSYDEYGKFLQASFDEIRRITRYERAVVNEMKLKWKQLCVCYEVICSASWHVDRSMAILHLAYQVSKQ